MGAWLKRTAFSLVVGLVLYYFSSQFEDIEKLQSEVSRLADQVAAQQAVIEQQKKDAEQIRTSFVTLKSFDDTIRRSNQRLEQSLDRDGKTSLGDLMVAKPALVEKIVNDATRRVFECMEFITKVPDEEVPRHCL